MVGGLVQRVVKSLCQKQLRQLSHQFDHVLDRTLGRVVDDVAARFTQPARRVAWDVVPTTSWRPKVLSGSHPEVPSGTNTPHFLQFRSSGGGQRTGGGWGGLLNGRSGGSVGTGGGGNGGGGGGFGGIPTDDGGPWGGLGRNNFGGNNGNGGWCFPVGTVISGLIIWALLDFPGCNRKKPK